MAIGCDEVSARMMELLYGELSGEDRGPLEAHLEGCAACRAELAALRATRVAARRALDADAPPTRARAGILRAAAAAVASKSPVEARPVDARPAPPRASFWERVRARWTLPTFATVGAVAVVVLASKVFLEPDKTVELGRQALRPARTEAPAGPAAETPPPEARDEERANVGPEGATKGEAPAEKRAAPPGGQDLAAAPERPARSSSSGGRRREISGGSGGLFGVERGKGSGALGKSRTQPLDDLGRGLAAPGSERMKDSEPPSPAKPARREFAPPPPPRAEPAPVAGANGAREKEDGALDRASAPPRAGGAPAGGASAPAPAAHAKAKKTAEPAPPAEAPAPAASVAASEAAADQAPGAAKRAEDKPPVESPVARADRLFTEGRWAEAARAYRDLLRRDPRNAEAARWRQRMLAAERAAAPEPPAPAAAPPPR